MKALGKFCSIGSREVPQLVKMIGPEPTKFAGLSARVDELVGTKQKHCQLKPNTIWASPTYSTTIAKQ